MDNRKETAAAPIPQIDYDGMAKAIAGVLISAPMTAAEINAALGTDYRALEVANAVMKYIPGTESCKVWRTVTNSKGEKVEREYTAYFLK